MPTPPKKLFLPPWTSELPDHSRISIKDLTEYNKVCNGTIVKYLPTADGDMTTSKSNFYSMFDDKHKHRSTNIIKCKKHGIKHFWTLGLLRQHLEVGKE